MTVITEPNLKRLVVGHYILWLHVQLNYLITNKYLYYIHLEKKYESSSLYFCEICDTSENNLRSNKLNTDTKDVCTRHLLAIYILRR